MIQRTDLVIYIDQLPKRISLVWLLQNILAMSKGSLNLILRTTTPLVVLVPWILVAESHYQKGGISYSYFWIVSIPLIANALHIFPSRTNWLKKVLSFGLLSFATIWVQNFILTPLAIDTLYSDKTWLLWEIHARMKINSIHYLIPFLTTVSVFELTNRLGKKPRSFAQAKYEPDLDKVME